MRRQLLHPVDHRLPGLERHKKLFGELPMRKGAFGETEDEMTEAYITMFTDQRLNEVIKFYDELGFVVKFPEVN